MSNTLTKFTGYSITTTVKRTESGLQIHSLVWWQKLPEKIKQVLLMNLQLNEKFPNPDQFFSHFWGISNTYSFFKERVRETLPSVDNVSSETIKQITKIKILVAGGLQLQDVSFIDELQELEYLCLYVNNIERFEYPGSQKLKYLDLGRNRLSGKQDFTRFPNLIRLDVERNEQITSLNLENIKGLTRLLCFENQLKEIKMTELKSNLQIDCSNPDVVHIYTRSPDNVHPECLSEIIPI